MKKSTKAALLSALVFPGLGHLYLRRYLPGSLLALGALLAVGFLTVTAVAVATDIVARIQSGAVPPDIVAVHRLVLDELRESGRSADLATLILMTLWVTGIAGAYSAGLRQELPGAGAVERGADKA